MPYILNTSPKLGVLCEHFPCTSHITRITEKMNGMRSGDFCFFTTKGSAFSPKLGNQNIPGIQVAIY